MPTNNKNNHIYDKKIRNYEKEVIKFFVEYGKNKRSDIESHILAYILLREGQWLTQENIRELSLIFYETEFKKGISQGSISQILNNFVEYSVLNKRKLETKKNAFEYSMSGAFNQVMSSAIGYGIEELEKYILFLKKKLASLEKIEYKSNEVEFLRVRLNERVKELIEFFIFHKDLYEEIFKIPNNKKKNISKPEDLSDFQIKKSLREIERDIIEFIINCPLFRFGKMKGAHYPIIAYFFTRKRLTQEKLKELTGFSAGMVSEGLNYMLQEGYINLDKVKGSRVRYYELNSIAYYNYLHLFRIVKSNSELFTRLDAISSEIKTKRTELKDINGYRIINKRVKQFLNAKPVVEKLLISFKDAMERFKHKPQ